MLTLKHYEKKIEEKLKRVRNLKENSSCWFKNERALTILWGDDPLTIIPRTGPTKVKKWSQTVLKNYLT